MTLTTEQKIKRVARRMQKGCPLLTSGQCELLAYIAQDEGEKIQAEEAAEPTGYVYIEPDYTPFPVNTDIDGT